jgi:hypothetical protein
MPKSLIFHLLASFPIGMQLQSFWVRSKVLRLHPRRLDSEALRRLQRWGVFCSSGQKFNRRLLDIGRKPDAKVSFNGNSVKIVTIGDLKKSGFHGPAKFTGFVYENRRFTHLDNSEFARIICQKKTPNFEVDRRYLGK